jgi:Ca-activated chloride channel family protein
VQSSGVDIVVAIDLSDSMLAEDVSPNRLARAKRKIVDLLRIIEGDRIGLVAFSGAAFLQSPLTQDRGAIEIFLDSLDTNLIPVKGTSLRSALESSLKAFEMAESTSRVLLMLTDGEELDEGSMHAAELAKQKGIRIYTIGIGSEKGAPIPNAAGGGFRKNPQGEIVFSKLNESVLSRLASVTGGVFVRSVSDDNDLVRIYRDEIQKNATSGKQKQSRVKRFEERFQWPLALMVLSMIGELLVSVYVRRKNGLAKSGLSRSSALLVALIVGGMWMNMKATVAYAVPFLSERYSGEQQYRDQKFPEAAKTWENAAVAEPNSAEIQFNLGAGYFRSGDFPKASQAWQGALKNSEAIADPRNRSKFRADTLYNLGNASYREGKLEDAATAYRSAKELAPDDREAAHNLELVLAEIKERKKKMDNQKNESQNQKEQKKQSEKQAQSKGDGAKQEPGSQQQAKDEPSKGQQPEQQQTQNNEQRVLQQQQQKRSEKLTKEEAERLLESLNDDQKKAVERKMRRENQHQEPAENPYDW